MGRVIKSIAVYSCSTWQNSRTSNLRCPVSENSDQLQSELAQGTLLLTGNKRLARAVLESYAESQIQRGQQTWDTPNVIPLNAWLHQLWTSNLGGVLNGYDGELAGRRLLSTQEEQYVWQQVIESSNESDRLINASGLASNAAQALASMQAACLDFSDWDFRVNEDAVAFKAWAAEFKRRCDSNKWITQGQLTSAITEMAVAGKLSTAAQILLSGFDEFTQQQNQLFGALIANGVTVEELSATVPSDEDGEQFNAVRIEASSAEEEIQLAAEWAKQLLTDAQSSGEALPKIAIVVLDMAGQRRACQVAFERVLHPQQFDIAALKQNQKPLAFNMSVGPALAEWPLITAALDGLKLVEQGLAPAELGRWLRSLWRVGEAPELTDVQQLAAIVDVYARKDGRDHWYLVSLTSLLGKERFVKSTGGFPALLDALNNAAAARQQAPKQQLPSAWCKQVAVLLNHLKWPGDLPPSSIEFQLIGAWNECLDELSGFDAISGEIGFRTFYQLLASRAAQNPFQPRSTPAPVQIMGLLEASGAQFDALWVVGMTNATWPAQPRPNPLLPSQWQRENNLPHASVERETDYAKLVTQRLSAAAPKVVFSWASHSGEEEYSFSPLLRHIPAAERELEKKPAFTAAALEAVVEDQWIPLAGYQGDGSSLQTGGGTSVIQHQAACGFRAFVTHRLAGRPLEEPVFGLDRRDRGTLVHEVMQVLWDRLRSQANLQIKSAEELESLVKEVVTEVATQHSANQSDLKQRLALIEQRVLVRLVMEWMELDRQRGPFSKVETEIDTQAQIGPLQLNVTADRIDTLSTGEQVVIDYKTSKNLSYAAWMGERPEEPQMPIYAVSLSSKGKDVAAVLYANLILGGCKYQGVTEDAELAPAVKANGWSAGKSPMSEADDLVALYNEWQDELARLATDYAKGIALIDPKNTKSCLYCGLQPVCRIDQTVEEEA